MKQDLTRLFSPSFPEVQKCKIVNVMDKDFHEVINKLGFTCKPLHGCDDILSVDEWKQELFYQHPFVDSFTKIITKIHTGQPPTNPDTRMTFTQFLESFRVSWLLDESTSVIICVDNEQKLISGMTEVWQHVQYLPPGLSVQIHAFEGGSKQVILAAKPSFCVGSIYLQVTQSTDSHTD